MGDPRATVRMSNSNNDIQEVSSDIKKLEKEVQKEEPLIAISNRNVSPDMHIEMVP